MIALYANLVKRGLKTIDQVPETIRDQVEKLLAAE